MYDYIDDSILTVQELMDTLKIGKNVAYQILNTGAIKAFRIGRNWKIPRASLDEFIINSAQNKCQFLHSSI